MKGHYFVKIGILLIIVGFIVTSYETVNGLVKGYLDDVNFSKEVVSSINTKYEVFTSDIDRYKNNLDDLYNSYNIYLEDFINSKSNIKDNIETINVNLVEILNTANTLNDYCNYDINASIKEEKCNVFKKNFKSSIDSYHKAINEYNRIVSLYNSRVLRHKKSLEFYSSPIDEELNKLYKEL